MKLENDMPQEGIDRRRKLYKNLGISKAGSREDPQLIMNRMSSMVDHPSGQNGITDKEINKSSYSSKAINKGKAIATNDVDSPLFRDTNKIKNESEVGGLSSTADPFTITDDSEYLEIANSIIGIDQSDVVTNSKNSMAETNAVKLDEKEEVKLNSVKNANGETDAHLITIEASFDTKDSDGFKIDFIAKIPIRSDADMRKKFLSKLTQEKIWLTPSEKPKAHQTCIIFDWDDTLLCTTFLNPQSCGNFDLPLNVKLQLKRLEKAAVNILTETMKYGEVYIITNAAEGWVEFSAKKYMPKLLKLFDKLTIMSARA
jgi:hypothetical protein